MKPLTWLRFFNFIQFSAFLLGYIFLGELLTKNQVFAGLFIILGSLLLSIEFSKAKGRFKTRMICLMLGSSFFYALNAVIFKLVAENQGFTNTLFWDLSGKFLFGVIIFVAFKNIEINFLSY